MSERDADLARTLLDLHEHAEHAIVVALAIAGQARRSVAMFDGPFAGAFEYDEAARNLRAALTALRSAAIDLAAVRGTPATRDG